jgi:xanthine dehydrogenase YagR molybdenum-binding subunit
VQVAVDPRLGRVRVERGWVGIGAGAVPALAVARSQVLSAFVQGVGLALSEDRRVDPLTGRILSRDLDDYLIPGMGDSAPVEVQFLTGGVEVRGGALDVGEVAGLAVPGAIANAVHAAIGRRPLRLPLTAPRVLELLQ